MKESLKPGLIFDFSYMVPENRTVPFLLTESIEFEEMPKVLATGFMVGLIEWACIRAINPYLDWPREQTVGTAVNLTHSAATPPGLTVRINGKLQRIEGRKLIFAVSANDGIDEISQGNHERFVIDTAKFNHKAFMKVQPVSKMPSY